MSTKQIQDPQTGEIIGLISVTDWYDGSGMTDLKCDGIIYFKGEIGDPDPYYKRYVEDHINVKWFGAKGDGINNDAPIINQAIDTTSMLKMRLFIPKTDDFYLIDPEIFETDESSPVYATVRVGMLLKCNMNVFSDGAILKLKDGISTETEPVAIRMFFSNKFLYDISISGLILDMNGLNNPITNKSVLPIEYSRKTQFHFGFSGTENGTAAGANNVLIENCSFINTAGVTCIAVSQSNAWDSGLGKNWIIRNCLFKNNGLDSADHSSIYARANDVVCYNNTFYNDVMTSVNNPTSGQVAYEAHGSNQNFFNNTIENYYQGLWVGFNNSQHTLENIYIYDNVYRVGGVFVDFYNGNLENPPFYPIDVKNVYIKSNVGTITNDNVDITTKQFVRINAKKAPSNVFIENNTLVNESVNKECYFFAGINNLGQVNSLNKVFINNNSGTNLDNGCVFSWRVDMDFGHVEILNNSFEYKNNSAYDIKCYGTNTSIAGKINNLIVSNINSVFSDNNNRAIISGYFNFPLNNMSIIGLSIENGSLQKSISSQGNYLTVNVELKIGSLTSFDGYPITFKVNGTSSKTSTVCDALIIKSTERFLVKGVVDKTGSWCTLVDINGVHINSGIPTTLIDGVIISCIFVLDNNKITI